MNIFNVNKSQQQLILTIQYNLLIMKGVEEQIQQQYDFIEKIGTGAFGHIISLRGKNDGKIYACKIEKNHGKKTILVEKQFHILVELNPTTRFPEIYTFRKLQENSYIIMEKLDKNIEEVYIERGRKLTLQTVALITEEMFTSLKVLHQYGYLHRDLKPENMMIKKGSHAIKLIDFGLADNLRVRRASTLIGNVRFCSRGAHFGTSSKKEDLQSLVFVLFYLISGALPWQQSTKAEIQIQINRRNDLGYQPETPILRLKNNFLLNMKLPSTKNQVKLAFYSEFMQLLGYVYNLAGDEPDYRQIDHRCERLLLLAGTRKGKCYEWCPADCPLASQPEPWSIFE